jgi:hypothetical protein
MSDEKVARTLDLIEKRLDRLVETRIDAQLNVDALIRIQATLDQLQKTLDDWIDSSLAYRQERNAKSDALLKDAEGFLQPLRKMLDQSMASLAAPMPPTFGIGGAVTTPADGAEQGLGGQVHAPWLKEVLGDDYEEPADTQDAAVDRPSDSDVAMALSILHFSKPEESFQMYLGTGPDGAQECTAVIRDPELLSKFTQWACEHGAVPTANGDCGTVPTPGDGAKTD